MKACCTLSTQIKYMNAHIKWNSGRTYTEHGQRLAAIVVQPDGVFAVDIDRGLSFFLPTCPLDQAEIMRRYDGNQNLSYRPPEMDVDAFMVLRKWLETYAADEKQNQS